MPNKTIAERLKRALDWPFKFLLGDDIFISYSRADGAVYAAGLADKLAAGNFSCRFDQWATEPGKEMPKSLKRALRRSAILVLVGSTGAAKSGHVAMEVAEMKRRRRKIVPVVFEGVLLSNGQTCSDGALVQVEPTAGSVPMSEALWAADTEGLPVFCEKLEALDTGDPSPAVINRIEKTFTFSRKDERLRKTTAVVASLLVLLIVASVVAGYVATKKGAEATRKTAEAAAATERARLAEEKARVQEALAAEATIKATAAEKLAGEKTRLAEEQTKRADTATHRADEQTQKAAAATKLAAEATNKATAAEKLAGEKAKLAEEQTKRADSATQRADEQTQKAADATKLAAAQELSAHKNLARSHYTQAQAESKLNPLSALAWASKAVQEAPAEDVNKPSYILRAMSLAGRTPLLVINSTAGLKNVNASASGDVIMTANDRGKLAIWDGRTGDRLPDPYAESDRELADLPHIISPDGTRAAAFTRGPKSEAAGAKREVHLLVWTVRTGAIIRDIKLENWESPPSSSGTMKFSPDGQELLFDPSGGETTVWSVASGTPLKYERPVEATPWSNLPVSRNPARNWFLAARSNERLSQSDNKREILTAVLEVRDIKTGKFVTQLPLAKTDAAHAERACVADFTPDAQKVVALTKAGDDHFLRVWNIVTGHASKPVLLGTREGGYCENFGIEDDRSFSPDGKRVLVSTVDDFKITRLDVWDISGDEPKPDEGLPQKVLSNCCGLTLPIDRAFFSDDGEYIFAVSAASSTQEVGLWNTRTQLPASQIFVTPEGAQLFDISTQAKTVTVAYKAGTLQTWDLSRDGARSVLKLGLSDSNFTYGDAALTPDQKSVLTLRDTKDGNSSLQLWDVETGVRKWPAAVGLATSRDIQFNPDGSRIFTLQRGGKQDRKSVAVRSMSNGAPLPTLNLPETVDEFLLSRDGAELVTMGETHTDLPIKRWSGTTGESLPGPAQELHGSIREFLGFTRFGEYCMVLPSGGWVDRYAEFTLVKVDANLTPVATLRFSDFRTAALAAALFKQAHEIHIDPQGVVATLDSGMKISVGPFAHAVLTNELTKTQVLPPVDGGAELFRLVFSPDARLLATTVSDRVKGRTNQPREAIIGEDGTEEKRTMRIWDAATGLPVSEPLWHEGSLTTFAFTPNSDGLVTINQRGVVRSWLLDVSKGDPPSWMIYLSEVLGGLRVVGGVEVERVSPQDYPVLRRKFMGALHDAAQSGDARARAMLAGRQP